MKRMQHYDALNDCWVDSEVISRTSFDLFREKEAHEAARQRESEKRSMEKRIYRLRSMAWFSFEIACRCLSMAVIAWMLFKIFKV